MSGELTTAGFTIKILQDILDDIRSSELTKIHPALDVADTRPIGQLNGIFAEREALIWELLRFAYQSNDPNSAEGWLLDAICAITGTVRRPASRSRVTCTVNLDASVTLPSGSLAHVTDQPLRLFRSVADIVATSGAGSYTGIFESVDTGPVPALAGTLNQIAGPFTGWNSITNLGDASLGIVEDTDTTLRQRREEALQKDGGATPDAIRSELLSIDGIDKVIVFENLSDGVDADGVPAHSIEVLVFDGIVPTIANNVIAQTIWDSRAAGVNTYGTSSGVAVDVEGSNHTIFFSRPTVRNVYIIATVDVIGVVPDTAATTLRDILVSRGNLTLPPGEDVVALALKCILLDTKDKDGLTWVHDVPSLKLGLSSSPTNEANLPISQREVAHLDTSITSVLLV